MDPVHVYLQEQIKKGRMPGCTWVVGGPEGIVSEGALGLAAVEPDPLRTTPETLYDLASLTKPLVTGLALAMLEENGRLSLDDSIGTWLPELVGTPYAERSLLRFAAHAAGLPAWRPLPSASAGIGAALKTIGAEPVGSYDPPVYSDLGYVCLGAVVERAAGRTLDLWFQESVATPLGLSRVGYPTRLNCSAAAPTERGNVYERALAGTADGRRVWRRALIRGEVHDGNAHDLGGVAGHAGLFGAAGDVFSIAKELLEPRVGILGARARSRLLSEALPSSGRTVGFVQARASLAAQGVFDDDAPGHVGFSGTSLWLQPDRERAYVLLTNRVHPVIDGRDFQPVRLGFHRAALILE